jgi:hypothetical protein
VKAALLLALAFSCLSTAALAGQKMCPMIYAPVCALGKDAKRTTLSSSCQAESAGARVLHKGACEGGDVCSMIYTPVCATDSATGKEKTYSSTCVAEHSNATLAHDGECKAAGQ